MTHQLQAYKVYFRHRHSRRTFVWTRLAQNEQAVRESTQRDLNAEFSPDTPVITAVIPVYWSDDVGKFVTVPV
ncbi:MAG: hypothetical protein A2065_00025 [Alphaproteobacteria bacterium GWB1_45_5]|nr:MAG: hypothetical protein A2065_00025 [Alphaproteobacteria bacterium GWB1_45_5]